MKKSISVKPFLMIAFVCACVFVLCCFPKKNVFAEEAVTISNVAALKADALHQKITVSVGNLSFSKTMQDFAGVPVAIQKDQNGNTACCITDTALLDAFINEINGNICAPVQGAAYYYNPVDGTICACPETIQMSISEGGRIKLLNVFQENLVNGNKKEIAISLTGAELNQTISGIPEEMKQFRYRLMGSCTTDYHDSSKSRCNNIATASGRLNQFVLQPGQEVSMDAVFLPRTSANGYQMAGAYLGGKVIQALGGGICQVSSTVYNASMNAGLTITSRFAHSMPVHYLPLGLDAAISSGLKDLKVRNDYTFPVLFETINADKKLTVNVYTNELLTQGIGCELHAVRTGSLSADTYLKKTMNGIVTEDAYIGTSKYSPFVKDDTED